MRQILIACFLLAALPGYAQTVQETLDELTAAESRDPAAWLALADRATAAGEGEIAATARQQAEEIQEARNPCLYDDRFRQFDFWAGEWEVHLENGTLAGTNSIQPAEKGCVLIEQWHSAGGGSGRSINYFDAAARQWVQVWNDASGSQIDIRGGLTDAGMLLEGQIHYVGNGSTFPFRGLWTPMPDGRVRQYFEQSNDGGESWTAWFEGFYSRKDDDAESR